MVLVNKNHKHIQFFYKCSKVIFKQRPGQDVITCFPIGFDLQCNSNLTQTLLKNRVILNNRTKGINVLI